MSTKKSLVEVTHDEGYGDSLLMHINIAFGGKDMRADKVVNPVASAVQVEGIPEGWELVRVGRVKPGEVRVAADGKPAEWNSVESDSANYVIIRKKDKRFRPFANAAEFEPHRDRWIRRKNSLGSASNFSGYGDRGVVMHGEVFTFDGLFLDHTFEDGTPFGVEVVE